MGISQMSILAQALLAVIESQAGTASRAVTEYGVIYDPRITSNGIVAKISGHWHKRGVMINVRVANKTHDHIIIPPLYFQKIESFRRQSREFLKVPTVYDYVVRQTISPPYNECIVLPPSTSITTELIYPLDRFTSNLLPSHFDWELSALIVDRFGDLQAWTVKVEKCRISGSSVK